MWAPTKPVAPVTATSWFFGHMRYKGLICLRTVDVKYFVCTGQGFHRPHILNLGTMPKTCTWLQLSNHTILSLAHLMRSTTFMVCSGRAVQVKCHRMSYFTWLFRFQSIIRSPEQIQYVATTFETLIVDYELVAQVIGSSVCGPLRTIKVMWTYRYIKLIRSACIDCLRIFTVTEKFELLSCSGSPKLSPKF